MKCWRCEKEIEDGSRECLYCHTSQKRSEPVTDPGQALRQLYDCYGSKQVLGNPVLLVNGLGDLIRDSLAVNLKRLKNSLRLAMDAGMGQLYLEQISTVGRSDSGFEARTRMILTEDAGFNEKTTAELMGYFDEMIGWKKTPKKTEPEVEKPPVMEIRGNTEHQKENFSGQEQIYRNARKALDSKNWMEALKLLDAVRGYKDTDHLMELC